VLDRLNAAFLPLLPQRLMANAMYRLARSQWTPLKNLLIRFVVRRYRVDLQEAMDPEPTRYPSFNAFFTRALKPEVRPVDGEESALVSPADGSVSQAGRIEQGRLLQAKGHDYALEELLGGDRVLAERFAEGSFATIYLSPRDYHRVHMPLAGRLSRMDFVPGELFSVSDATAQLVPRLFARNERVITLFETAVGPVAVILVGAIFVGSIETVWSGEVRERRGTPVRWVYPADEAPELPKGVEMGRFNMGSTVILVLPKDVVQWARRMQPGERLRMGERIGTLRLG
jgi:phosphatidylserine decarboxylase